MPDRASGSCASSHLSEGSHEDNVTLDPVPSQMAELLVIAVAEQHCEHLRSLAEVLLIPLNILDKQLCEGKWILCSASPKPHPSKPHPCNIPQAKTEVALQFFECCAAETALQHSLFCSADVICTKSCAAAN